MEHDLAKVGVAGSSPVSRFFMGRLDFQTFLFCFAINCFVRKTCHSAAQIAKNDII